MRSEVTIPEVFPAFPARQVDPGVVWPTLAPEVGDQVRTRVHSQILELPNKSKKAEPGCSSCRPVMPETDS